MSGTTAEDPRWQSKEQADEARHVRQKEQAQLETIKHDLEKAEHQKTSEPALERDFEGGYGGQEDLEDRYATTCGEH